MNEISHDEDPVGYWCQRYLANYFLEDSDMSKDAGMEYCEESLLSALRELYE